MKIKKKDLIDLRKELASEKKPMHSLVSIKNWYKKVIKRSNIKVKTIPLEKCKKWKKNKDGQLYHTSGGFYKVEGVRIINSFNREVKKGWDQPMFTEKNFDGGILGLLKTNINSNPHYLVNAKFEPGNYKFIQLSPTVQATFSNINKAHGGSEVKFLNFFKNPKRNKCRVIFRQWVSEEGGRLRNKRNLGMLVDYYGHDKINFGLDYKWLTLAQIKILIQENAMINPHLRTLVSFI